MPLLFKSELDSSGFERGIKRMDASANAFGKTFERFGAAALAGTFAAGVKSLIDFGSHIRDAADNVGVGVESLQELEYAFGQSGASAEVVDRGLVKLTDSIAQARSGNVQLQKSFQTLSLSLDEIDRGNFDQILMKIAQGFKESKDPAAALGALIDVMGKSAQRMAGGFRQGTYELSQLRKEASRLTEDEVAALDNAGDAYSRLWTRLKVFGSQQFLAVGRFGIRPINPATGRRSLGELRKSEADEQGQLTAATLERKANERAKREKEDEKDRVGRFKEELGRLADREQFEKMAAQLREHGMQEEKRDREAFNRLIKDSQDIAIKAYEDTLTDEQLLKKLEKDRADIWLELRLSAVGLSKITAEEGAEKRKQLDDLSVRIQKEKQITKEIKERTDFAKKLEGHHLDPALTRVNVHAERRAEHEARNAARRIGGHVDRELGIHSGGSMSHATRGMTARERALGRLPATIMAQLSPESIKDLTHSLADEINRIIAQ